jgi:hypothetical protein
MICSERERLTEEYFAHVLRFRDVVLELTAYAVLSLIRAYRTSEDWRIAVVQARLALKQHRTEHKC